MKQPNSDQHFILLHTNDIASLEPLLALAEIECISSSTLNFSADEPDHNSYQLFGTLKQIFQFVSSSNSNKNIRVITNDQGNIKEVEIKGFNKEDTLELLEKTQDMYIHKK